MLLSKGLIFYHWQIELVKNEGMDKNNPTDKEAFKLQAESAKETLLLYQWWTKQRAS